MHVGQDLGPFAAKEDALDHATLPAPHSHVEKRGLLGAEVALAQELDTVFPYVLLFQEPLREPLFVLAPRLEAQPRDKPRSCKSVGLFIDPSVLASQDNVGARRLQNQDHLEVVWQPLGFPTMPIISVARHNDNNYLLHTFVTRKRV